MSIQVAIRNFAEDTKGKEALVSEENITAEVLTAQDNIYVKHNGVYSKLLLKDICYIESDKNYVHVALKDDKYLVRSTLKDFKNLLLYLEEFTASFFINNGILKVLDK